MSRSVFTRDSLALVCLLVLGVVGPGLLRWWFEQLGMSLLGTVVFTLGYGTMVVGVWYGWIRPLDLSGPAGTDGRATEGETGGGSGNANAAETGGSNGSGSG